MGSGSVGQILRDTRQQAKPLGSCEDKFAGLLLCIDSCLEVGKQGRAALRFIQNGAFRKLVQVSTRICFGKFPLVEIFKRYITMSEKDMSYQR